MPKCIKTSSFFYEIHNIINQIINDKCLLFNINSVKV